MSPPAIIDRRTALDGLRSATEGLLYVSETDAPFELVDVPAAQSHLTETEMRRIVGESTSQVEQIAVDDFFAPLTESQAWHGPEEKADVDRYRRLRTIMATKLSETTVFRVGTIQVRMIIAGLTSDGHWVGVTTRGVAT